MYIVESGQRRTAMEYTCLACGNTFIRRKYKRRAYKYCSHECARAARRIERVIVECATCGKEIERLPSRIKKSKSGLQFCSMKCKAKAHSLDGTGKCNSSYRRVAFNAYPHKCDDCGYDEKEVLVVHHKLL